PNRAQIAKRTVGHEGVEQSGRLEEVDEERQLPKRRHRRLLVPLDPDRPEKTVQVDPFQPLRHNHRLLTRPVSPRRRRVALHALENARFSPSRQNQTAVSRFNPAPPLGRRGVRDDDVPRTGGLAVAFFRELECNGLKNHDSRVNKGVKSSAERVSNACRRRAERRRMEVECASLRGPVFRFAARAAHAAKKGRSSGPALSVVMSDRRGGQPPAAFWAGPESLPLASTSRSTNSITAMAALSPGRKPAFMMRV